MSLNNGFMNSTIICNERKDVDLDALNLLASAKISRLCSCSYKSENKHHHFIYDTCDLIPFSQLQADLSFENVIEILSSVVDLMSALAENDLVLDNVKKAKDYIFKSDDGYKFIYIPIVHKPHASNRDFVLRLISIIHHKDVRLMQFVKEFRKKKENEQALAFLKSFVSSYGGGGVSSEAATSLLSEEGATSLLSEDGATTLLGQSAVNFEPDAFSSNDEGETTVLSAAPSDSAADAVPSNDEGETTVLSTAPTDSAADVFSSSDEGETTVLSRDTFSDYDFIQTENGSARLTEFYHDESGEYETTVLTSQPTIPDQPVNREIESEYFLYLIRNLNGEKITVDVTPFTIGKDRANMDYVLNNDSVSRQHATIVYENGNYFIMDNNSTNGTTIEGIRLQPGEKGEIGSGYIISLGNESFQAHIERR